MAGTVGEERCSLLAVRWALDSIKLHGDNLTPDYELLTPDYS